MTNKRAKVSFLGRYPAMLKIDLGIPPFNWNAHRWNITIELGEIGTEIDFERKTVTFNVPSQKASYDLGMVLNLQNIDIKTFWAPGQYVVVLEAYSSNQGSSRYEGLLTTFTV